LSKADGVMIGRACYGKPWLISQINDQLCGKTPQASPDLDSQLKIVLSHFNEMIEHYGIITGIALAKKHIGWYSSGLNSSAEFRAKINLMGSEYSLENKELNAKNLVNEISMVIEKFYETQHNFLQKEIIN
jgi:tRNA-dihydrouridine synthase B